MSRDCNYIISVDTPVAFVLWNDSTRVISDCYSNLDSSLWESLLRYKFDKHWHYDFNATKCPPWDLSDPKRRNAGLFGHPPRYTTLTNKVTMGIRDKKLHHILCDVEIISRVSILDFTPFNQ